MLRLLRSITKLPLLSFFTYLLMSCPTLLKQRLLQRLRIPILHQAHIPRETVIVPISHTLHTESIQGLTGFSTTHFSHHTNKSICRSLPIIINLLTFVFYCQNEYLIRLFKKLNLTKTNSVTLFNNTIIASAMVTLV